MKLKITFIFISFLFITLSFSQDKNEYSILYYEKSYSINLSDQSPPLNIIFQSFVDSSKNVFTELRYKIIIFQVYPTDTLQIIDNLLGSPLGFQNEYPGLTFYDINFDGFKDIQMFQWVPSNHGYPDYYNIYLYDYRNEIFLFNKEYTEKIGCNFSLDEKNKNITASIYSGSDENYGYSTVKYKVENGGLILIDNDDHLNK